MSTALKISMADRISPVVKGAFFMERGKTVLSSFETTPQLIGWSP